MIPSINLNFKKIGFVAEEEIKMEFEVALASFICNSLFSYSAVEVKNELVETTTDASVGVCPGDPDKLVVTNILSDPNLLWKEVFLTLIFNMWLLLFLSSSGSLEQPSCFGSRKSIKKSLGQQSIDFLEESLHEPRWKILA